MTILNYFFEEPEREFHIRELAKLMKISPTTASKQLNQLKKEGLLTSREKFNHLLFKADIENIKFKDSKLNYNIKKIRDSGLIEHLDIKFNHPRAIILFGSFAKAENVTNSDIDLLIITPLKKEPDLKEFEKKLKHEIQLFLHSQKEIKQMKNKELLNSFINGIVLKGYWELFE
ncbi:MAG: nucleotidyltransferase domain-containing protein [archaeon]